MVSQDQILADAGRGIGTRLGCHGSEPGDTLGDHHDCRPTFSSPDEYLWSSWMLRRECRWVEVAMVAKRAAGEDGSWPPYDLFGQDPSRDVGNGLVCPL